MSYVSIRRSAKEVAGYGEGMHIVIGISNRGAGEVAVSVLPCFMALTRPSLVRILPAEIRLLRSYWLITHTETRDLAPIRLLSDFILKEPRSMSRQFWI